MEDLQKARILGSGSRVGTNMNRSARDLSLRFTISLGWLCAPGISLDRIDRRGRISDRRNLGVNGYPERLG